MCNACEGTTVNKNVLLHLERELSMRGYGVDGNAPKGTMSLGREYLSEISTGELLDQLITRREKVFRSLGVVGRDVAEAGYGDVAIAIEALKSALSQVLDE
jgi:hypothetical protein